MIGTGFLEDVVHIYAAVLWLKNECTPLKGQREASVGKIQHWLVISRTWITLTVLGSTCYHLLEECSCCLLPETSAAHHRSPAALQSPAGLPLHGWWGRSVSTLPCNADSTETHDAVTQQAWPAQPVRSVQAQPGLGWLCVCLSGAASVLPHRHHCSCLFLPEGKKPGVSLLNPECAAFSELRNSLLWIDFQEHS